MRRAILVGCGNAKQDTDEPVPAEDLYTSGYFTKKMGTAEALDGDEFIISAKHRVLHPDKEILPYEEELGDLSRSELALWRWRVSAYLNPHYDTYVLFMGEDYRTQVRQALNGRFISPFEDTVGIGDQMSVLGDIAKDGLD